MSEQPHGAAYGYGYGFAVPPMPSTPPPAPPDGLRAAAVGLLNLGGLGLGYALTRRWALMAACWFATGILLLVALPADPDGVPMGLVVAYLVLLLAAAVHGAVVGLRTRLVWPTGSPLAIALGLVLLAVPAGGVVLYDMARDEANEQALLDRLDQADRLVRAGGSRPFGVAETDYRKALREYRDIRSGHPDSRAAARVPDRLKTYYTTVGAAYEQQDYCTAIPALAYLRTVPATMGRQALGTLAAWPDDRLATSLYECGAQRLGGGDADWTGNFGDLLGTFPDSEQAAKVAPAVDSAVDKAAKGVRGSDPCTAVDRLRTLGTQAGGLNAGTGDAAEAVAASAARAGRSADSGVYACGVDQYKEGDFGEARETMNKYVADNKNAGNRALAKKFAIAAEVADEIPSAGKRLPTLASGGSIPVTIKNDSPNPITVLYTGPVTGSLTLKACRGCTSYSLLTPSPAGFKPCQDSGRNYPQRTIRLPVGTTYFLHKSTSSDGSTPASDTAKLQSGYLYTECAYTTRSLGF
ncbi:hypothetical protein [Actinacidiphila glaucinigra]|uniref:hypothetical protein n=1 Tax=Actinacidiphila glaucinigra TaxID=235986 RepID=UPI002E353679|nr:hypothetical protein [Actinacidiphila glaucinigra]